MWNKLCLMTTGDGQNPASVPASAGTATEPKPHKEHAPEAKSFQSEVLSLPGGEGVRLCIQCGVCSASCPNVSKMDYSPRKTIAMIRADARQEVLTSNSPWICASCYMCTVRCPRNVKPTELMHALERLSMQCGLRSAKVATPAMYAAFVDSVKANGRVHEAGMMMKYFFATNPFAAMKMTSVALGFLSKGRMAMTPKKIKGLDQLNAIVKKAKALGGTK